MNQIEKAIEILKKCNLEYASNMDEVKAIHLAVDVLKEKQQQRWIPVSERWPGKSGYYLVTYREWSNGDYLPKFDDTRVKILKYQESIFRLPVCCDKKAEADIHREVIAWQQLPEPYKEGSNE